MIDDMIDYRFVIVTCTLFSKYLWPEYIQELSQ